MSNRNIPIPPKTDSAYVYDSLRADILSGRIRPNERIVETYYAQKLGVSRTPVREALRLLERDGLVDFQPKRGASARPVLQKDEEDEVFRLRVLLQLEYARETVENLTKRELTAMAGCNAACASAIDAEEDQSFFRHYNRFNKLLMEGCKTPLLIKMLAFLRNFDPMLTAESNEGVSPVAEHSGMTDWSLRRRALREHIAIWSALEERDVEAYKAALQVHFNDCRALRKVALEKMKQVKKTEELEG